MWAHWGCLPATKGFCGKGELLCSVPTCPKPGGFPLCQCSSAFRLLIKAVIICISLQVWGGKKREDTERHKTKPSSNSQCNAVEVGHIAPFLFIFFFSLSISAIITVIDSEKCKLICSSRAFYCVSPFLCVLTFQILEGCGVCIAILIPIILACCLLLNWVLDRVSTCTH